MSHCVKSWGTDRGLHFYKETDKIYKKLTLFRIFSTFAVNSEYLLHSL